MTATRRGRGNGGRGSGRGRNGRNGGRPPQAPRHGRDPPGNGGDFNPDTAKDRNGSYDMQGILNGDYDFLINRLKHIKQASYSTEEYNKLNPLEKRKNWFNQQKQKANDPSWRPSRRPSPNVLHVLWLRFLS